MSVEDIKEKNQYLADRMNATGMEVVEPVEMFTPRKKFVVLYNQMSQFSN